MKLNKRIALYAHIAACLAVLLASCKNPLEAPTIAPSSTVTITLAGAERSIMPSNPSFSRYTLTLRQGGTTLSPDAAGLADGGVTVELKAGDWSVTVDAYQELDHDGNAETPVREYQAATATKIFTVKAEGSNAIAVQLEPIADTALKGVFAWDITLPQGTDSASMSLGTLTGLTGLDLTLNADGYAEAPSGVYYLSILLSKDGLSSGRVEMVHIYGGLQTTATLDLSALVFGSEVLIAGTLTVTGSDGPESGYAVNAYASMADAESESNPIAAVSSLPKVSAAFLMGIPVSAYNALGAGTSSGKRLYLRAAHPEDSADSSFKITANAVVTVDNLPASGATGKTVSISVVSSVYTVTFNANGGSVTPASVIANDGSSLILPTPTMSGYKFDGWYTASSNGTRVGGADDSYIVSATIMLYAQWKVTIQEGVYIGIISFAGNATDLTGGRPILLDADGRYYLRNYLNTSYTKSSQGGTALFYAVHKALANLKSNESGYPDNLDSVNMITFTDGLDNGSFGASNPPPAGNPIEGQEDIDSNAYLTYVQEQIASRQINGKPVTAFSAGVMGNDISDTEGFQSTLEGIASPGKSSTLSDFAEVQTQFEDIANGLNIVTDNGMRFTMVTPRYNPGEIVRMTFDNVSDAASSAKYIQGTIRYSGGTYSISDIAYAGGLGSDNGAGPIVGTINGAELNFVFTNVAGYEEATDYLLAKQWHKPSEGSAWQINSEYNIGSAVDISVERRSSVIYLVLDASTSLLESQIGQIRSASIAFIDSLYGRSVAPSAPSSPGLSSGNGSLTVSWNSVPYANSYKVYYSTSSTAPTRPVQVGIEGTSTIITGLTNNTTYYVWVQATNNNGDSALSNMGYTTLTLQAPPTPSLTAGDRSLTVSWDSVPYADSYKVYYSTSSTAPSEPVESGIEGTSTAITGLANNTQYYVWVRATNSGGDSALSQARSINTLALQAPNAPGLSSGDGSLTVTWNEVSNADSYKVYYDTSSTAPSDPVESGIEGTSTVITGLANNTQYYVWVRATNNGGDSALSYSASIWTPCFYEVDSAETFAQAISSIRTSGSVTHTITVTGDFTSSSSVAFSSGKNQSITIKGDSTARSIANGGSSAFFTVPSGTTLILDSNIILDGNAKAYSVVSVNDGTLRMNDGAAISNAASSGVSVSGGTFTMSGGTISGNTAFSDGGGVLLMGDGTFTMSGGTISGNTAFSDGGGVYVSSGTFRKSGGGTIDDTNSASTGKVACVYYNGSKRDATAGPSDDLDSSVSGSTGGWE